MVDRGLAAPLGLPAAEEGPGPTRAKASPPASSAVPAAEPRPHPELSAPKLRLALRGARLVIVAVALLAILALGLTPWYIYETPLSRTAYSPVGVVLIFGEPFFDDWDEFEEERVDFFGLDSSSLALLYRSVGAALTLSWFAIFLASVAGSVAPPRVGAAYFTRTFLTVGLVLITTAGAFAVAHPSAWAHDYPYVDAGERAGGSFWGEEAASPGGGTPGYRWFPGMGWLMALAVGFLAVTFAFANARWLAPSLPPITPPGAVDEKDLLASDFCKRCGARLERPICWRCGKKNR